MGLVVGRKKLNPNDAFRRFNNDEVDVLMINQSGSTGASAHAIPTGKVPREKVRQRVMIVLQAELDINTEVQKRGRINRTGQIYKPIYDYITSAIPAEVRLMMMLQKKLKSLDANTTSNQKQSSAILDVPDFLNKYGDKLVVEYLADNREVNVLLGDPLHLLEAGNSEASTGEDAAHRVSGRVAVLSTHMQEEFYNEMAQRYVEKVDYLRQVGEYDLEVEAMNLEAETTGTQVVKMGTGNDSAFGTDSVLETVTANVLRKPFTREQLHQLLNESLAGVTPDVYTANIIHDFEGHHQARLSQELDETRSHYEILIESIGREKKMKKLEADLDEWQAAYKMRKSELETARNKKDVTIKEKAENNKRYLLQLFRFFYPGRLLRYPITTFAGGHESVTAVFIGLQIDNRKSNPFAPSQVKLRFALANGRKYLVVPASMSADLLATLGQSTGMPELTINDVLTEWEAAVKAKNVDRSTRYIVTGNILQAFADFPGKLVSYTTVDQQIKKGILLPEEWNMSKEVDGSVTIPIASALPFIKSLQPNKGFTADGDLSIFRGKNSFKIILPDSRSKGGAVYLDKDLLALVVGNNFQKTADKMVADVRADDISNFVTVLERNHNLSVVVTAEQFRQVDRSKRVAASRKAIMLPPPENPAPETSARIVDFDRRRRLVMKAKALKLRFRFAA